MTESAKTGLHKIHLFISSYLSLSVWVIQYLRFIDSLGNFVYMMKFFDKSTVRKELVIKFEKLKILCVLPVQIRLVFADSVTNWKLC